jgi:hypothetical protein
MVASKEKSAHISDEDWAAELRRHAVVTADRQLPREIKQEAATEEAKAASFAGYATDSDAGDSLVILRRRLGAAPTAT